MHLLCTPHQEHDFIGYELSTPAQMEEWMNRLTFSWDFLLMREMSPSGHR